MTSITTGGDNQAYTELDIRSHETGTAGGGDQTYTEVDITSIARGAKKEGNEYESLSPAKNYMHL